MCFSVLFLFWLWNFFETADKQKNVVSESMNQNFFRTATCDSTNRLLYCQSVSESVIGLVVFYNVLCDCTIFVRGFDHLHFWSALCSVVIN